MDHVGMKYLNFISAIVRSGKKRNFRRLSFLDGIRIAKTMMGWKTAGKIEVMKSKFRMLNDDSNSRDRD
jgi:hypothetical protein